MKKLIPAVLAAALAACSSTPSGLDAAVGLGADSGVGDGGGQSGDGGACGAGQASCGGACVGLQADREHCGSCDHACPSGEGCQGGSCAELSCDRACTGQICDTESGECVDCLVDADCASSDQGGRCDRDLLTCVECLSPNDCLFDAPGCSIGVCGGCSQDSDCPGKDWCGVDAQCHCYSDADCGGDAPVCLTTTHLCGCSSSSQCMGGQVCDRVSYAGGACVDPCTAAAGCDQDGYAPYCDTAQGAASFGVCLPCLTDQQCVTANTGRFCSSAGCVECRSDADCKDPKAPRCAGACVQCESAADCPGGQGCDSSSNTCGSCVVNSDCPAGSGCGDSGACQPICVEGAGGGCARCVFGSECPAATPYCSGGTCSASPSSGADAGTAQCGASTCFNQVCDPATTACVDCLGDDDCAARAATPHCSPSKACVECLAATDCPFERSGCADGFCGKCASSADCPSGQTCGTDSHCHCHGQSGCGGTAPTCIAGAAVCGCSASSQCPAGDVCDQVRSASGVCTPSCATNASACNPNSFTPYCNTVQGSANYGACLPCLSDSQCASTGAGSYCTPGGCVDCRSDSDCKGRGDGGTPLCNGGCVQCASWRDCAVGACNALTGQCGSCAFDSDCPADAGTCSATKHTCN